jgi:hypothetical protein
MEIRDRLGNAKVRALRPLYWAATGVRWGPIALWRAPTVVGNTMAKSGSHLLGQILRALPKIGPFMFTPWNKLNRGQGNAKLSRGEAAAKIRSLFRGEVAYTNLAARAEFVHLLTRPGMATIYVYRDPRDLVVSQVFYVTEMYEAHALHDYAAHTLRSMDERLDLFILGNPDMQVPTILDRYKSYSGWLEEPGVLALRFEDLIVNRRASLAAILGYIEQQGFQPSLAEEKCVDILEQAIVPQKSPTFRRGQPGNWREHFSEQNKQHFRDVTGDLLVTLGYEKDDHW